MEGDERSLPIGASCWPNFYQSPPLQWPLGSPAQDAAEFPVAIPHAELRVGRDAGRFLIGCVHETTDTRAHCLLLHFAHEPHQQCQQWQHSCGVEPSHSIQHRCSQWLNANRLPSMSYGMKPTMHCTTSSGRASNMEGQGMNCTCRRDANDERRTLEASSVLYHALRAMPFMMEFC